VCGEKNDAYTVNLLWHAYRTAAQRAGLELRETTVFRAKVKDAVKNYRERYADLMALRVVRGELSLHRVRLFVADQRQQELNHLLNYRIQPVESDIYTRVKNLWKATRKMGVESITGINGEAGLWKLSSVLNTVLCNDMLSSALSCPVRQDCFAVQFNKSYFGKKIAQAPTKHEQLMNVLSFLNIVAPGSDNRNKIRLPSAEHDTVTVILYNTSRDVVDRHVQTLNRLHEMETGGCGNVPIKLTDVHDMTIRCMIDAGARIGRSLTGKTGQTLEIASFKWMRGLWESVVCNAFPTLAFTGEDSHQNYNAYAELLRIDKLDLVSHPYTHGDMVYEITIEHGGDGACRRNLQGNVSVSGFFKNEQCTVCSHTIKLETDKRVQDIITLWSAMWFIISCGFIGDADCHMFNDPVAPQPAQFTPRQQAERAVRHIAATLDLLLHGVFGFGSIWTPTVHTLVHDVVRWYCDLHLDLFFGNEQSIESCQQQARNMLYHLQSSKQKNTDMILRWIAWQLASYEISPPVARQEAAVKRQMKSWNEKRWPAVKAAIALFPKYPEPEVERHRKSQPWYWNWVHPRDDSDPWAWRETTPTLEDLLREYEQDGTLRPVLAASERTEEEIRKKAAKKLAPKQPKGPEEPAEKPREQQEPAAETKHAPTPADDLQEPRARPPPVQPSAGPPAKKSRTVPTDTVDDADATESTAVAAKCSESTLDSLPESTLPAAEAREPNTDTALDVLGLNFEEGQEGDVEQEVSSKLAECHESALTETLNFFSPEPNETDETEETEETKDEVAPDDDFTPFGHQPEVCFARIAGDCNLVAYVSTKHRPLCRAEQEQVAKDRAVGDNVQVEYQLPAKITMYTAQVTKVNGDAKTVDVQFHDGEVRENVPLAQVFDLPVRARRGATAAQRAQQEQAELAEFAAREQWGGNGSGSVVYGLVMKRARWGELTEADQDDILPGDVVVQPLCVVPGKTEEFKVVGGDDSLLHHVMASEVLHGHYAPSANVRAERMTFRAYNIPSEVQQEARRRQRVLKRRSVARSRGTGTVSV
jgi:hypothetical protein